jgi:peptide/nickel transport system substrate-binding protein
MFRAWYGKDGPQNYSFWDNQEFQALTTRIDREVDPARRLQLVHQAEAIMEQDPPLLPVAWERINEVWYDQILFSGPERERSRSSRSIRSNSARS